MPKIAPGVSHTITPPSYIWNARYDSNEDLMIEVMNWKKEIKGQHKIPAHRMPHKFHQNKLKSA